jgi:hypothetical protein
MGYTLTARNYKKLSIQCGPVDKCVISGLFRAFLADKR